MKTIDKFFVTKTICVPLDANLRHEQCPHAFAARNIYLSIVEEDIADIEVKNGGAYCWSSCNLTNCRAYLYNKK